MLPTVTAKELKDAMPQFREEAVQKQVREEIPKLPFALRVRCGLVDYILNGEEGTGDMATALAHGFATKPSPAP